jgi:hypothetical protein
MPKVRVNDIEMYYEIHGKGIPLVHIGGLAGDARTWMPNLQSPKCWRLRPSTAAG